MSDLCFTVLGCAVPYPRASFDPRSGRRFTDPKSTAYRKRVAAEARAASRWLPGQARRREPAWPSAGECARAVARMKLRPKGQGLPKCECAWCRTEYRIEARVFLPNRRTRDIDNLIKNVFDACTGVLWYDDSQVAEAEIVRDYDKARSRMEITVRVVGAQQGSLLGHAMGGAA